MTWKQPPTKNIVRDEDRLIAGGGRWIEWWQFVAETGRDWLGSEMDFDFYGFHLSERSTLRIRPFVGRSSTATSTFCPYEGGGGGCRHWSSGTSRLCRVRRLPRRRLSGRARGFPPVISRATPRAVSATLEQRSAAPLQLLPFITGVSFEMCSGFSSTSTRPASQPLSTVMDEIGPASSSRIRSGTVSSASTFARHPFFQFIFCAFPLFIVFFLYFLSEDNITWYRLCRTSIQLFTTELPSVGAKNRFGQ